MQPTFFGPEVTSTLPTANFARMRATHTGKVRHFRPCLQGGNIHCEKLNDKNPEVARALLPWLENADWAKEVGGERRRLISALGNIEMPESVPGLIAVLNEKQTRQIMTGMAANRMGSMANTMGSVANQMMNSNRAVVYSNAPAEDYFPLRSEAIGALAKQKDARAIAPLRAILPEIENWQIHTVIRALLECGGFSIPEQIEALEFIAKNNIFTVK